MKSQPSCQRGRVVAVLQNSILLKFQTRGRPWQPINSESTSPFAFTPASKPCRQVTQSLSRPASRFSASRGGPRRLPAPAADKARDTGRRVGTNSGPAGSGAGQGLLQVEPAGEILCTHSMSSLSALGQAGRACGHAVGADLAPIARRPWLARARLVCARL